MRALIYITLVTLSLLLTGVACSEGLSDAAVNTTVVDVDGFESLTTDDMIVTIITGGVPETTFECEMVTVTDGVRGRGSPALMAIKETDKADFQMGDVRAIEMEMANVVTGMETDYVHSFLDADGMNGRSDSNFITHRTWTLIKCPNYIDVDDNRYPV